MPIMESMRAISIAIVLLAMAVVPGCKPPAPPVDKTAAIMPTESKASAHHDPALPSAAPCVDRMAVSPPRESKPQTPQTPALAPPVESMTATTVKDVSPLIRLDRWFPRSAIHDNLPVREVFVVPVPANVVASVPRKSELLLNGTTFGYMWMSYKIVLRQDGKSTNVTVDRGTFGQGTEKRQVLSVTYDDFIRIWYAIHLNPPDSFGSGDLEMHYLTMDGEQVERSVPVSGGFTYMLDILLYRSPGYEPSLDVGGFRDEPGRDCGYETFKTWLFDKTASVK